MKQYAKEVCRQMPPRAKTTVTLKVPPGFVLPALYEGDPAIVAEVLAIGATLYETVKRASTDESVRALEVQSQRPIETLKHESAERIRVLETQIEDATTATRRTQESLQQTAKEQREAHEAHLATLEREALHAKQHLTSLHQQQEAQARKEEREATQRQFELRFRTLQDELALQKEKEAALLERKAVLEQGRDADIRIAEERTRALLQTTLDEKERSILRTERTLSTLQEAYAKQTEALRSLEDLIRKKPSENAKIKGNVFEEIFQAKLVATFGLGDRFAIEAKGNNGFGHEADFVMKWAEHAILWEVKDYGHTVNQEQVDKFLRDMRENPHAKIGVMVSRHTPIVGKTKTGDRAVEFFEGKMLIFLSRFESMSEDTLANLLLLFRLFWESERCVDDTETKEESIRQIESLHTRALQAKKDWRLHKSRNDETMRWMAEQVEEHETKLKQALNVLRGAELLEVPTGLFREFAGDESAQQLVQLILEYAIPTPGESVTLNDTAEFVGKRKGLSKDTARTHIRGVLLDTAYEQLKGKPGRILGLKAKEETNWIRMEA
jgi:hypothetical protein